MLHSVGEYEAGLKLKSILELTDDTCRWPIGDPLEPGFGFCGCQTREGKSYCEDHYQRSRMSFGKPETERAAA